MSSNANLRPALHGADTEAGGSAAVLIRDLRAPHHRQPVNPWAIYRTRDIQLFEDAAVCLERLCDALQRISAATMASTNSATADQFQGWVKAVSVTALADTSDGKEIPGGNP